LKSGIGYTDVSTAGSVITLKKNNGPRNPWGADIEEIQFTSSTIGKTLNVKISVDECFVMVSFKWIRQYRISGGLIFSDKFLQLATYLPSDAMYGWGENVHPSLKHNFTTYRTWGMLARDEPPNSAFLDTKNLYGVHPFYMILEPDGNAHGVFILNSNPQEVTTTPGPALIYRTIGGNLDLYFFPGPTPEEVTQQYLALIGTPFLPAYWALGYQLSRYGYKDLDDMVNIIERNIKAGVPMDTAVADIDYMDRYKDFTIGEKWAGLSTYVSELHSRGMRTVLIFDPAIQVDYESFERAMDQNARFIEWEREDQVMHSIQEKYPLVANTKIMLGVVWPDRHVAFPDFFDTTENTTKWWIQEFVRFRKQVPYDGIWIDMNEPANFGTNVPNPWYFHSKDHPNIEPLMCPSSSSAKDNEWDMPPYKTHSVYNYKEVGAYLATKTLCMMAVQANGTQRFYNVKNLYGWSEARATQQALQKATGKRGTVISRSTFPSSGRYAGHWLGDNSATWQDLQTSIIGAQEFNIFGIPYVGSDICGFNGVSNEELCLRWQQMGAFHSFMRNHNAIGNSPQDPAQWPSVAAAARKANLFRYRYLPYLFSLHFAASMMGGTVVRPLFYEYPRDKATYDLGHQFLWGSSMLIAPVIYQNAKSVDVYLPEDDWYSLFDHNYGQSVPHGRQTFPAPWTSLIPVFVRGGSILPRQTPNVTTDYTRQNAFELLIAPGARGSAEGLLFWDDGESIVNSFKTHDFYHMFLLISFSAPTIDTLEILNYNYFPDLRSFKLNNQAVDVNVQSSYNPLTTSLYVTAKNFIDISAGTVNLSWNHSRAAWSGSHNRRHYELFV
uniref:Gal_mutarotas_2 domain-containing protein n=1 Tax=Angiostrongylus cantonensis TaxID=6313 RepID=A0A158P7E8_ANGCA